MDSTVKTALTCITDLGQYPLYISDWSAQLWIDIIKNLYPMKFHNMLFLEIDCTKLFMLFWRADDCTLYRCLVDVIKCLKKT